MKRKHLLLAGSLPAVIGLVLWAASLELGLAGTLLKTYALAALLAAAVWFVAAGLRTYLWRVSRRLAFSYFLIGILPIALATLLVLVAAYIFTGFFLGHLYRDAVAALSGELRVTAERHLEQLARGRLERSRPAFPVKLAYYRGGKRVAGDRAPVDWQDWWLADPAEPAVMVTGAGGAPTLLAAASRGRYGVLVLYDGDLARELSERSGIWVELMRADEADAAMVRFFHRELPIKSLRANAARQDLAEFLQAGIESPGFIDRPLLMWVDVWQSFLDPATGMPADKYVSVTLTASLRAVHFFLIARSAEVGNLAYLLFFGLAFLLFDIYVIAALMAVLMIFGLSRAVNRLTEATQRIRGGDFSTRIEVHRRDQIGALQGSFNVMAENLEKLVAETARKEILEKDLSIARELQQSLLPDALAAPQALRFATHFEPSSAIGGDYYDILQMAGGRLAVVVADAAGHGISAGLRIAMFKSALQVLCEREDDPEAVLGELHRLLREGLQGAGQRGFVTATLALVDHSTGGGKLRVTNAGHPPTYLLRDRGVREIVLPSLPLGTLDCDFASERLELVPGDLVVWLSDGLIEARGEDGDFGYQRVVDVLTGLEPEPELVKRKLLDAVAEHTRGAPPEDDCTLVVMAYQPAAVAEADETEEVAEMEEPVAVG